MHKGKAEQNILNKLLFSCTQSQQQETEIRKREIMELSPARK